MSKPHLFDDKIWLYFFPSPKGIWLRSPGSVGPLTFQQLPNSALLSRAVVNRVNRINRKKTQVFSLKEWLCRGPAPPVSATVVDQSPCAWGMDTRGQAQTQVMVGFRGSQGALVWFLILSSAHSALRIRVSTSPGCNRIVVSLQAHRTPLEFGL